MSDHQENRLILASRSAARARLLEAAGITFTVAPAAVDEAAIRQAMTAEAAPGRDIADKLAEIKALRAAARHPAAVVLGADQLLVCEGTLFEKPRDMEQAAVHLRALRGRRHELLSAAVICEGGRPVWRHVGTARLEMREFSEGFLAEYLECEGAGVLACVGAYRLEGRGAQLFSRVSGDFFSVLGLPLVELLAFLRRRGICRD